MDDTKVWWRSRTLWGAAFTFIGLVLPNFINGLSPDDISKLGDSVYNVIDALLTFGGLAFAVYSRITATQQLTLRSFSK